MSANAFRLADAVAYQEGAVVSRTLVKAKNGSLTVFAFDRGQGLSEHTAAFDATVYLLEGSAEISVGTETTRVSAGEMIMLPAHVPHAVHARERFKMVLTMIKS